MGSAVSIVVELYEALSEAERAEVIKQIMKAEKATTASYEVSDEVKAFGDAVTAWAKDVAAAPKTAKRVWKRPPYWTKTVESVDKSSTNASGAAGKWGFEPGQSKPVLFGLNKPRHLYAVLKATPGETTKIADDDGFVVEIADAVCVLRSKDWADVREQLAKMLDEF